MISVSFESSIIYKLFPSSLLSVFNVCCEIMTLIIE